MDEHNFLGRDLISVNSLSKEEILGILNVAESFKREPRSKLLDSCVLASCFFEPSTRTRLSFESAMLRLGGQCLGFSDSTSTSSQKGESLTDSMRMIEAYADIAVIRHPLQGAAQAAADAINIPVVNAGDGSNQHPSQTLLDLYSMRETQGRLDELKIAMLGDLRYGRTVHSLAQALVHFNCRLYFIAPESLDMPQEICDYLRQRGVRFSFHNDVREVLPKLDILYMTRIQQERFSHSVVGDIPRITADLLRDAPEHLRVLHPLPRVDEIARSVDTTPKAYYFQQAENGVYVRQALLALLLGKIEIGQPLPC